MTAAPPSTKGFSLDVDRGVLVVTIHTPSVTNEQFLEDLKERVVDNLERATTALLFDCAKLTGRVTSQFLATLVSIRKKATKEGVFVCASGLAGTVREAYEVSCLDRIIPLYDDRELAIRAVGDYGGGRIAQGKVDPSRLGERSKRKDGAPHAKESRDGNPTSLGATVERAADSLTSLSLATVVDSARRVKVSRPTAFLIAAIALAASAAIVVFATHSGPRLPTVSTDDRPTIFGGKTDHVLLAQVNLQSGDLVLPDAGAMVLAWNIDKPPEATTVNKTIYRYLNENTSVDTPFPQAGMHVARTSEKGRFGVGLPSPGTYQLLIISSTTEDAPTLTAEDGQMLANYLETPGDLIGKRPYRLRQETVRVGEVEITETFQQ